MSVMMELKKKRGRPRVYKPKNNIIKARITDEDMGKLEYIRDKNGMDTSEIIRDALDIYYKITLYK